MTNNNGVITGSPSEDTAITDVVLDIANDSTFRDTTQRQDVADHEIGLLAAKDELAGVHALGGDEELLLVLVPVGVTEGDAGEGGAAPRVVDDVNDHAL